MYMDLPLKTNFNGLFITNKDVKHDELLPSYEFYTENE